jgi:hypothetical protein
MAPRMRAHALASLLVLLAAACGGSSSETPPPLEPDPTSLRYTGPRFPSRDEAATSAAAEPEPEPDDGLALPARPARATWGTGSKPAPKAAPAPSSPPPSSSAPAE